MPSYPWLKLWSESRTDPKLESLADDEFRVWFRLLTFANDQSERGVIVFSNKRLLAVQVARGDVALLERTLTALRELEIITDASDDEAEALYFTHWEKRQAEGHKKPSDSPERVGQRVAKHREQKRQFRMIHGGAHETGETPCNAHVTPPELELDTSRSEKKDKQRDGDMFVAVVTNPARGEDNKQTHTHQIEFDDFTEEIVSAGHVWPRDAIALSLIQDAIAGCRRRGLADADIRQNACLLKSKNAAKGQSDNPASALANWLAKARPAQPEYHAQSRTRHARADRFNAADDKPCPRFTPEYYAKAAARRAAESRPFYRSIEDVVPAGY